MHCLRYVCLTGLVDAPHQWSLFQCSDQENGQMKASHLGDAMRSAGMNPTNSEVRFGSDFDKERKKTG